MKLKRVLPLLMLPLMLASCGKSSGTSVNKPSNDVTSTNTQSTKPSESASTSTPDTTDSGKFTIEAEYTNLDGKKGAGYSGGSDGKAMVQKDKGGAAKASNGYWVGYLYVTGLSLDFVFNSTKAVNDVTLTLRLTCEIKDITLTSDNYKVNVNGTDIDNYGTITLAGASTSDSDNYVRPFSNHKLKKKINIVEGQNTIKLVTANNDGMGGTMYATAPMVDSITLSDYSDTNFTYEKIEDNLSLFEE